MIADVCLLVEFLLTIVRIHNQNQTNVNGIAKLKISSKTFYLSQSRSMCIAFRSNVIHVGIDTLILFFPCLTYPIDLHSNRFIWNVFRFVYFRFFFSPLDATAHLVLFPRTIGDRLKTFFFCIPTTRTQFMKINTYFNGSNNRLCCMLTLVSFLFLSVS